VQWLNLHVDPRLSQMFDDLNVHISFRTVSFVGGFVSINPFFARVYHVCVGWVDQCHICIGFSG